MTIQYHSDNIMKTCKKCGSEKDLVDFYRHPKASDGHDSKCKECAKAAANKHRADNLEKVKAYDRTRNNLEHRVAARAAYRTTDAYAVAHAKANAKYVKNNPAWAAARTAVGNAVRDGKLFKSPCFICGADAEAHHPDYSQPLDVVWLCDQHHKDAHTLGRDIERAAA